MPGTSDTQLMRHLGQDDLKAVFNQIASDRKAGGEAPLKMKTVEQMAATSVWAAIVADADDIGGRYLENCHVAEIDDVPGMETMLESEEREAKVREALTRIPGEQMELVRASFFLGYSHSEIAACTGLPLGTVKSRIRLAFEHLRKALDGHDRLSS